MIPCLQYIEVGGIELSPILEGQGFKSINYIIFAHFSLLIIDIKLEILLLADSKQSRNSLNYTLMSLEVIRINLLHTKALCCWVMLSSVEREAMAGKCCVLFLKLETTNTNADSILLNCLLDTLFAIYRGKLHSLLWEQGFKIIIISFFT